MSFRAKPRFAGTFFWNFFFEFSQGSLLKFNKLFQWNEKKRKIWIAGENSCVKSLCLPFKNSFILTQVMVHSFWLVGDDDTPHV